MPYNQGISKFFLKKQIISFQTALTREKRPTFEAQK
jgi:hypothetical protein